MLSNRSEWPGDVALEATAETRAEAKVKREILAVTSVESDEFDQLLDKYDLFTVKPDVLLRATLQYCDAMLQY